MVPFIFGMLTFFVAVFLFSYIVRKSPWWKSYDELAKKEEEKENDLAALIVRQTKILHIFAAFTLGILFTIMLHLFIQVG